jgi:YggT family protein
MNRDPHDKTNLGRRQELQRDEEAFRLSQAEGRLRTAKRSTAYVWIINSIFWLTGVLEVLLSIRFFLRLFGANPENWFAQLIYSLSAPLMVPFSTLFISPTMNDGAKILDVNLLIAIVVYALLSYLIVSLVKFIFYHKL